MGFSRLTAALLAAGLLSAVTAPELRALGGSEPGVSPQVPSVTLSVVSPQPFTIGDPIDVSLTMYHHRGEQVTFPEDPAHFSPFVLKEITVRNKRAGGGIAKTMVLYTISAFQTGNITLNPLPVMAEGASLETDPLVIPVLSVLPREDPDPALKDIVGPYRARIRPVTIAVIFGSLSVAFLIYLLLSRLLRRRVRKAVVHQNREKPVDPYRFTLDRLTGLKRRREGGEADAGEVYLQLSHLLRLFFGYLWELPALEMTTAQIRRALRRRALDGEDPEALLEMLGRSDLVKFARERPAHPAPAHDIDRAIELVKTAHRDRAARQPEHAVTEAAHGV